MKKLLTIIFILAFASSSFAGEMRFPSLRIKLDVPEGWQAADSGSKVIISSPDDGSLVSISKIPVEEGEDPLDKMMDMTMSGEGIINIEKLDAEHYAYNVRIDDEVIMCSVAVKMLKDEALVVNCIGSDPALDAIVSSIIAYSYH